MRDVRLHAGYYPNLAKDRAHWRGTERAVWHLANGLDDAGLSTALDLSAEGVRTYATRTLICCEDSRPFAYLGADTRILWIQHAVPNLEQVEMADAIVFSSAWQQGYVRGMFPRIPAEKCLVIGLGAETPPRVQRRAHRVLYASAPERGLHHALRIFRGIRETVPDAELHVTYGVDEFVDEHRWEHHPRGQIAQEVARLRDQPGVTILGQVSAERALREVREASLLLYPCDPLVPSENFCIAIAEAVRAGTIPLFSDADCLGEVWREVGCLPLPIVDERWIAVGARLLTSRRLRAEVRARMAREAPNLSWPSRVREWQRLFAQLAQDAPSTNTESGFAAHEAA